MRFLTLDLIRYGHFTGKMISFREDAPLHIIYGHNEAGKSSALAAISDLLFDFPDRNVRFDFLHEARDLRVGGTVSRRDGERLSFIRRKGRKNTLLDGTLEKDVALNDDALAPYLGGLTRDVFERAFGLDSTRLRSGGDEMLKDGGEIGQLLFSAASGLTGLKAIGNGFADAADAIYKPRARNLSFNQALERHEAARKSQQALELNAKVWKDLLKDEQQIEEELAALEGDRAKRQRRIADLNRLQQLRGLLAEMDRHAAALAAFADLATVSGETGVQMQDLSEKRDGLIARTGERRERLSRLEEAIDGLKIDPELLARRGDVARLRMETGLYRQALDNRPELQRRFDDTCETLNRIAAELGLGLVDDIDKSIPNKMLQASVAELIDVGRELEREEHGLQKNLREQGERLAALKDRGDEHKAIDPTSLKRRYEALRPAIIQVREAKGLAGEVSDKVQALRDAVAALRPACPGILDIARGGLPQMEEIRQFRERIGAGQQSLREAETELQKAIGERDALAEALSEDRRGAALPTRADIERARHERDDLWRAVEARAGKPADQWPDRWNTVFQNAVSHADRLADDALDDAEQVAARQHLVKQFEKAGDRCQALGREAEDRKSELEATDTAYRALFGDLGLAPAEPEVMLDWLRRVDGLFGQQSELRAMQQRLAAVEDERRGLEISLRALAADAGADGGETMPLSSLETLVSSQLQRLADSWDKARDHMADLNAAERAFNQYKADLVALGERRRLFDQRFGGMVAEAGLDARAGFAAVETALKLWAEIPGLVAQKQRLEAEIAEADDRIARFDAAVTVLVDDVAADLAGMRLTEALEVLEARVGEQSDRAARRQTMLEEAESLKREIAAQEEQLLAVEQQWAAVIASLPSGVVPDDLPQRLEQRGAVTVALQEARRRFAEIGMNADEDDVRDMAATTDAVECALEIEALSAEEEEARQRRDGLLERRAGCRQTRAALETGESAETAAFERASAEAEAKDLAREWVVLKLAENLLRSSVERYRQNRADPILEAAGRHFGTLTEGAFAELLQSYGADDDLVLMARRANGDAVGLDGLSDGTRDQLYLALRLAFLEDYAQRNEPAPLIVDDIFQTFDDSRSAAGLRALSELDGVQTILFTHERSLAEIAQSTLGARVGLVEL